MNALTHTAQGSLDGSDEQDRHQRQD